MENKIVSARSIAHAAANPAAQFCFTMAVKNDHRPKWRLCFRIDRESIVQAGDVLPAASQAWKQRDFYITVIDPPVVPDGSESWPSVFASATACQIANLMVNKQLLAKVPGQSFENKVVVAVGKECMAAGLVAAMLGSSVCFVCEQEYVMHVQHNIRLYVKDTLDYTKKKNSCVKVLPLVEGETVSGKAICDGLNSGPLLHLAIVSEAALDSVIKPGHGPAGRDLVFDFLSELVDVMPTKVLLMCDGQAQRCDADDFLDEDGWQVRTLGQLSKRVPILWLEHQGGSGESTRSSRQPTPSMRRFLPPMGAQTPRCGCGGNPQKQSLKQSVINPDWHERNARLKSSLQEHNRVKAGALLKEAQNVVAVMEDSQQSHLQDSQREHLRSLRAPLSSTFPTPRHTSSPVSLPRQTLATRAAASVYRSCKPEPARRVSTTSAPACGERAVGASPVY